MTIAGVDQTGQVADTGASAIDLCAADAHALIIAGDVVMLPSGRMRRPAPDSVTELGELIEWAWTQRPPAAPHKLLQTGRGCPQVWIVGVAAVERLGLFVDRPDGWGEMNPGQRRSALAEEVRLRLPALLAPLLDAGWKVRGKDAVTGPWTPLERGSSMVDVVLEPYMWVASQRDSPGILGVEDKVGKPPTGLPDDDGAAAAELGRRLAACVQQLGELPAQNAGRTGAAVADRIWRTRKKTGKGVVIDAPGAVPDLDGGPAAHKDLESPADWTRDPAALDVNIELLGVTYLALLDQRRAYLGSTSIDLGYGTPTRVSGQGAAEAIADGWSQKSPKTPFGLVRVWLPATAEIGVPDWLPPVHPLMASDRRVQAWITTRSVKGMCDPVADGGAGVELDDLDIHDGWLWPSQGRVLEAWTTKLRKAGQYFEAAGDDAMDEMVKGVYAAYVGRMQDPDKWTGKYVLHHHQPVWRAFIMAETRWRNRRHAMSIYRRYGLKPLDTATDSWTYALKPVVDAAHPDNPPALPDLVDPSGRNGTLKLEKSVELNDELFVPLVLALTEAQTPKQVQNALKDAFDEKGI